MAMNPQGKVMTCEAPFTAVGAHTKNATLSSAVTLTAPAGVNALKIQAETKAVRYRLDGTAPDATTGFSIAAGALVTIQTSPGGVVKIIEAEASATVQYQWGLV
jgi:hypothetical protein